MIVLCEQGKEGQHLKVVLKLQENVVSVEKLVCTKHSIFLYNVLVVKKYNSIFLSQCEFCF